MMRGKPTLGYPSRTDAIVALRARGLDARQIADEIGIPRPNVVALERHVRTANVRRDSRIRRTLELPQDLVDVMAPFAAARDIGPRELALRILAAVADDGLVDAILDDREPA